MSTFYSSLSHQGGLLSLIRVLTFESLPAVVSNPPNDEDSDDVNREAYEDCVSSGMRTTLPRCKVHLFQDRPFVAD